MISRGSTTALKMKLCTQVQYGGRLMSNSRYSACMQYDGTAMSSRSYAEDPSDEGTLLVTSNDVQCQSEGVR